MYDSFIKIFIVRCAFLNVLLIYIEMEQVQLFSHAVIARI